MMEKQKIIIIGSDFKWEEQQLIENYDHAEFWLLGDLEVHMGKNTEFLLNGKNILKNLKGNEKFIIRRSRGNYEKLVALVEILEKRQLIMTDSFRSVVTNLNKEICLTTLESELFPHPDHSFFIENGKSIDYKKNQLKFPMISKPVLGRHGEGVMVHDDFESLQKTINESDQNLLIQQFLVLDSEYRIFIVGNEALGAVTKKAAPGKQIANYAAGATFNSIDLPTELLEESVRLCQSQGIDIGGVDIVKTKEGRWHVLEINRCPEFQAFSKATQINVAQKIIDFTLKK